MMVRRTLITPLQRFVKIESSRGMLLFGSSFLALLLANSFLGEQFLSFWQYRIGISAPGFELNKPILLWINDGKQPIVLA